MAGQPPTLLTPRQRQVLRLRSEGRTIAEVARILGTSKQNVHALEAAARSNVERARGTLAFWRLLSTPVVVAARPGEDIDAVVGRVLAASDAAGIHVPHNRITLANAIYTAVRERFRCTSVVEPFDVGVTREGEVVAGPPLGDGPGPARTARTRARPSRGARP